MSVRRRMRMLGPASVRRAARRKFARKRHSESIFNYFCAKFVGMNVRNSKIKVSRRTVKWLWGVAFAPIAFIGCMLLLTALGVFGRMPSFEGLENPKSNLATEIYSEDGKVIGSFFVQNRSYVQYADLFPSDSTTHVRLDGREAAVRPSRSSWPRTSSRATRPATGGRSPASRSWLSRNSRSGSRRSSSSTIIRRRRSRRCTSIR